MIKCKISAAETKNKSAQGEKMKKVVSIEDGVKTLFEKGDIPFVPFKYIRRGDGAYCDLIEINGESVPLYKWRYNVKVTGLKVNCDSQLGKLSTLRTSHFAGRDKTLKQILFIELDVAEFTLGGKIVYIMGFGNERAANFIVKMDNGTICSLELAVTMPEGSKERIKRSVFSTNGMTSTVSFDEMLDRDEVHLFSDGGEAHFTDIDVNLYGLTTDELDTAYAIFGLLRDLDDKKEWIMRESYLETLANDAVKTLKTHEKAVYGEDRK